MPKATLELASELIGRLTSSLPEEIDIIALGPSKLPFKVLTLRETLIHRLVELAAAAVDLFAAKRVIAGVILTRAGIETVAILFAVAKMVEDSLEKGSASEIDENLMKLLFGGRSEMATLKAINVLTHIDKLDKKFEGLRWWYEQLSDIAHPNYPGLVGSYADIDQEEFRVALGPTEAGEGMGLPALCTCLELFIHIYNGMIQPFGEFVTLCTNSVSGVPEEDNGRMEV